MQARALLTITILLGGAVLTGCGAEGDGASATTVVERVTVPAEAAAPDTTEPDDATGGAESADASDPADTPRKAKSDASSSDCTEVPDVVGLKDLQLSQDTLQAAGFYAMEQEDATGQDRVQLLDRNWVVTRQDPAAGECVPLDTTITTYAKKHGE